MPDKEIMLQIKAREESRPWVALDALTEDPRTVPGLIAAFAALAENWRTTADLYEKAKLKGAQTAHVIPLRHAAQQLDRVIETLNQPRRAPLGELQPATSTPFPHGATVNAGLDEAVHCFQVGPSGTTCTAMVERNGAGEDCGRYASHPAHRLQSGPAPEETIASLDALIAESAAAAHPLMASVGAVAMAISSPTATLAAETTAAVVSAASAEDLCAKCGVLHRAPGTDVCADCERRAALGAPASGVMAAIGVVRDAAVATLTEMGVMAPPADFPGQASGEEVTAYLRGEVDDIPGPPLAPNGITDMTERPWRVLVTGSRTWDDVARIHRVLEECRTTHPHGTSMVVVHGACPSGADAIAAAWCKANSVATEEYPADWNGPAGKGAGLIRNQAMIDSKPNECVAFIHDESKGASHCAALAERAGIPTTRFTSPSSDITDAEVVEYLRRALDDAPPPAVHRTAREILESNPVTMPSIPPVPLLGQPGNGGPAYDHSYIPPGGVPATYAELLIPVPRAALPAHISHSQIGTAGECGVKYRLQRLPRDERVDQRLAPVEQIPQWANIGGNAFHAVVEDIERGVAATSPDVLSAAPPETLWEQHFGAEIAKIEGTSPVPRSRWRAARKGAEGEAWWWTNGPLMIERYLKARPTEPTALLPKMSSALVFTSDAEVAIELERTVPVDTPYGPIDYRAIIDRVTVRTDPAGATTLVIRDYKSGYQMPDSTQQLGEYAQVLRLLGVPAHVKITGTYFNARKGEWTPEADLEEDGWSAEWFRYHVATGHAERLKLTSGPTPARPSQFCGGCPVRWACPLKNGAKS